MRIQAPVADVSVLLTRSNQDLLLTRIHLFYGLIIILNLKLIIQNNTNHKRRKELNKKTSINTVRELKVCNTIYIKYITYTINF